MDGRVLATNILEREVIRSDRWRATQINNSQRITTTSGSARYRHIGVRFRTEAGYAWVI